MANLQARKKRNNEEIAQVKASSSGTSSDNLKRNLKNKPKINEEKYNIYSRE